MDERRVVITGMALRSPIGNTVDDVSAALKRRESGIRVIREWEKIEHLRTRVAGVCEGIDENEVPRKFRRSMGRVAILAALAAQDAIRDSGLTEEQVSSPRCGVSFGSTAGSSQSMEEFLRQIFGQQSLKGLQSSTYLQFMSHTCAANLAMMFQVRGPVVASCTACVAGSQGVGFGYEAIRLEIGDHAFGGAEEMHFMDAGIFDIMRATSTALNDRPEMTPRPFDRERDGLVGERGRLLGCRGVTSTRGSAAPASTPRSTATAPTATVRT
jgi:3-oxoacyl-[acyl-carrier-protein] synthase II